MKVLMINGGASDDGCTANALNEIAEVLRRDGIDSEIIHLGKAPVRDCIGCQVCRKNKNNRCVFDDDLVNVIIAKAEKSDGFIFASPVYYAHPTGRILSVLDRAFYAGSNAFAFKPGAAVASARRGGTSAALDVLNKYFTINRMPVVSSSYWNMVHGAKAEDVAQDEEGVQTLYNLAKNMAWMLKLIQTGKETMLPMPECKYGARTNFIR